MSMIMSTRHFLVFPDGLVQEVEERLDVEEGDLISSEHLHVSPEPAGKFEVRWIEEIDPGEYPHIRRYHLRKFG